MLAGQSDFQVIGTHLYHYYNNITLPNPMFTSICPHDSEINIGI